MLQVLIVEDEKPISNLIRLSLTKEGYHCTCAFDGAAAADLLVDHHYDLILLDVMLPGRFSARQSPVPCPSFDTGAGPHQCGPAVR